ncbi:phosphonatase-like hydrolase [Zhouia sp. PK063]|uniref:phosphonatase-like hydrolase n=1 Tax=Zhouia sp. PK063 TaxID=3373602 RepID=UPI0037AE3E08
MHHYKMVVFDMAGTTINENNVVYKTLHTTICKAGYEITLNDVLANGAGKEKFKAIQDITNLNEKEALPIFKEFQEALASAYCTLEVTTFNGVEETFSVLKKQDIKVILNTGYDRVTATKLIEKLQWKVGHQIDDIITADDVETGRPLPDMILLAMEKHQITNTNQVIKIGDSDVDILEGKNANCGLTIGITTGAHTEKQLKTAKPDFIIHQMSELLDILKA